MATIQKFTFNAFQENTYVISDESGACIIIDPGCNTASEEEMLTNYIATHNLDPVRLINTHCHIDHVLGNRFVADMYQLELEIHRDEVPVLQFAAQAAMLYQVRYEGSPEPGKFIDQGDTIEFGNTRLQTILTPGHSPASISFFHAEEKFLIAGDVLFYGSIGRTDLPGGDYDTLIASIRNKLLPLGDDVVVHPGHGPETTIGHERKTNPFLTGGE